MPIKINGTNTAANPSITGDDTDTGIVYGSDQIDLSTGGSSKVTLNGSNLGVGTTSPASPLHSHLASSDANRIRVTNSTTGATASDGFIVVLTSAEEGIIWNYENTDMPFGTNNTERMRILAGGGLTFNGDTAAANAISDYEEGTFTPDWQGDGGHGTTSYGSNVGSYTKIGKLVHISLYSTITGTTASGAWKLNNLPFGMPNSFNYITTGSCMLNNANFVASTGSWIVPYKPANTSTLYLYATQDNTVWRTFRIEDDSAFEIILGITYRTS